MLGEFFMKALPLAMLVHADQKRKGTDIPYFSHLMSVAALVQEHGGDDIAQAAAILHDAIEDGDSNTVTAQINLQLGPDVFEVVMLCSDSVSRDENNEKLPWKERKEAHLKHLYSLQSGERSDNEKRGLLIMTADKLHNARTILEETRVSGDQVYDRFKGGKEGTLWYYTECSQILGQLLGWPAISHQLMEVVKLLKGKPAPSKIIEYHSPIKGSVFYDASTAQLINQSHLDFFKILKSRKNVFQDLEDDSFEQRLVKQIEEIEALVTAKASGLVPSILSFEVSSQIAKLETLKEELDYLQRDKVSYKLANEGDLESILRLLSLRFNGREEGSGMCRIKLHDLTTPL